VRASIFAHQFWEENFVMNPTFSTPHFDVFKDAFRDRHDGTSKTFHRYEAHFREADAREHDWPAGVVVVRGNRGRGPKPVVDVFASNHSEWSYGEICYELLLGVREHTGPLSLELIDYECSGPYGLSLRHAPDEGKDLREIMQMVVDGLVPQSLRNRLLLSAVDDTWNQLMQNELVTVNG
jgi:hypothetical protein